MIGNSTPGIGWPLIADIKELAAGESEFLRRVFCELDFTSFDTPSTQQ